MQGLQKQKSQCVFPNLLSPVSARNGVNSWISRTVPEVRTYPWLHLWEVQEEQVLQAEWSIEAARGVHILTLNVLLLP